MISMANKIHEQLKKSMIEYLKNVDLEKESGKQHTFRYNGKACAVIDFTELPKDPGSETNI